MNAARIGRNSPKNRRILVSFSCTVQSQEEYAVNMHKNHCSVYHSFHNLLEIADKFFDKWKFCGIIRIEVPANQKGG